MRNNNKKTLLAADAKNYAEANLTLRRDAKRTAARNARRDARAEIRGALAV